MKTIKIIIPFIMIILLQGCLTEPDLKKPFSGFAPKDINDGWTLSTPSQEGIDSLGLVKVFRDFHNDEDTWQVRSLTVIRNGRVVAESYTKDESELTKPRAVWSCTKQFLGVLVGIALEQGYFDSLDDPLEKYMPDVLNRYPDKKGMTIKDLLMMRSGIDYTNYGLGGDDAAILQQEPDNLLEFVMEKPLYAAPGTDYKYKDSDPQVLSALIEKVTGRKTDLYAEDVLMTPNGIENYQWERYKDGSTIGAFGIVTTPREMGKLAQMVLNSGTWNGHQIVSQSYLTEMISPVSEADTYKYFGYMWWSYSSQVAPNSYDTYFMSGNGRQLVFVIPDKSLIVIITSNPRLQGDALLSTPTGREYAMRIARISN